jgi:DHA2 family multidrug resistance protein-like MFS transporter
MIVPAYVAMTMPTTASTAMGSVSPDKAGIASGVVNASRQVGGALGIAVLGTVGASVASSHWSTFTKTVPAPERPKIAALNDAVVGGQARVIGRQAGSAAQDAAASAFVHGLNAAMYVGSGLTLAAALVAFFGLKGFKEARARAMSEAQAEGQTGVPPVVVEA